MDTSIKLNLRMAKHGHLVVEQVIKLCKSTNLDGDNPRLDGGLHTLRYLDQLVRVDHLHRDGGRYCEEIKSEIRDILSGS